MKLISQVKQMSSLEISELVEQRHDNVKRTIERNIELGAIIQPQIEDEQFTDSMGRPRTIRVYKLDKESSIVVVAQLCPQFTARLVNRWQSLEQEVARLKEREDRKLIRHKVFLDRLDTLQVPIGHFCVLNELAWFTKELIREGLAINEDLLIDISVGQTWAHHWKKLGHTERIQYAHNYPSYFKQAQSNPQPAWAYPDAVLPEFRRWLREEYFGQKFQVYLKNKSVNGATLVSVNSAVQRLIH